jgi:hypothetical protein
LDSVPPGLTNSPPWTLSPGSCPTLTPWTLSPGSYPTLTPWTLFSRSLPYSTFRLCPPGLTLPCLDFVFCVLPYLNPWACPRVLYSPLDSVLPVPALPPGLCHLVTLPHPLDIVPCVLPYRTPGPWTLSPGSLSYLPVGLLLTLGPCPPGPSLPTTLGIWPPVLLYLLLLAFVPPVLPYPWTLSPESRVRIALPNRTQEPVRRTR